MLHLFAVAVAPFANLVAPRAEPPGGGPLRPGAVATTTPDGATIPPAALRPEHRPVIHRVERFFRPYLDLLYLNHGYSFFAPEPGPSYIMRYEVHQEDGSVVRGRLPDLEEYWPRLLYHRYFMLATQNLGLMMDAEARGKIDADSTETLAHAIAREVTRRNDGQYGVLRLYTHRLLWPEEVLQGKSPDARDTYVQGGEIVYSTSGKAPPREPADGEGGPPEEVDP